MSAIVTELLMTHDETVAYQIRCHRSWLDRVKTAANELGLTPAAYIRMAITQRMDADGIPKKLPKGRDDKKK